MTNLANRYYLNTEYVFSSKGTGLRAKDIFNSWTDEVGNNESHSHQMCLAVNDGTCTAAADMSTSGADSSEVSTSIDNNPPYTAVYMFRRTA